MKILCKKSFSIKDELFVIRKEDKSLELFTKNKWYNIIGVYKDEFSLPNGEKTGVKIISYQIETNHPNNYDHIWLSILIPQIPNNYTFYDYNQYFYTQQEIRKLKLKKLKT